MGIFNKGKKGTFLIVLHEYWMGHKSWSHEYQTDITKKEADALAALYSTQRSCQFNHCTATVIKVPDHLLVIEKQSQRSLQEKS